MAFLRYSLLRLGLLVAVFILCYWLGLGLILSGVAAIVIAWAVTYLFFSKLRAEAAGSLQKRFAGRGTVRTATEIDDAKAEDALVDQHPDVVIDTDTKRRREHPRG